tara:strand:- start:607 stop:837 length:231 start_codon:yes stop_codon:yes gene_type:complete
MSRELLGGKGAGLVWLRDNQDLGFNVPEFEIIDTRFHEEFLKQLGVAQLAALLQGSVSGMDLVGSYSVPSSLGNNS